MHDKNPGPLARIRLIKGEKTAQRQSAVPILDVLGLQDQFSLPFCSDYALNRQMDNIYL
jgi:hypothetical protein